MIRIDEAVSIAASVEGFMQWHELYWLADKASTRNTVLELGSWKGRSTKALALVCPGTVYAVDHWKGSESEIKTNHSEARNMGPDRFFEIFKANLKGEIQKNKVIPIRAESQEAVNILGRERGFRWVDMLFIDGDHMYESVKRDIQLWKHFVVPGGLLCGHDFFDAPGVRQAVKELLPNYIEGSIWSYIVP